MTLDHVFAPVFVYFHPDPTPAASAGTWVTFGGQITDEVRTDGFCHFLSVKVQEWKSSIWSAVSWAAAQAYFYLHQSKNTLGEVNNRRISKKGKSIFSNQGRSLIVKSWSVVSYPVLSSHCSHCSLPVLSQQMAEQLMTLAYENGINLFDTAEVYAAGKWVDLVPAIIYKWAVKANIIKLLTWEWLLKAPCAGCATDTPCLRVTSYM